MDKLLEEIRSFPGQVSFYYHNLVTGETAAHREDLPLVAASVIKLAVLTEAFARMETGDIDPDEPFLIREEDKLPSCGALTYMHNGLSVTFRDLFTLMIVHSDNTATNLLIRRLGMERINGAMQRHGLEDMVCNRLLFDSEASARGIQNTVTARACGHFFALLYRGKIISPQASTKMLDILRLQRLNGKIPFMLPAGTACAHKTGEDSGITHDVGIVYARQPFVVCFCSNRVDVPAFEYLIHRAARQLYDSCDC